MITRVKDFLRPYISYIPRRVDGPSWRQSFRVLGRYGCRPNTVFDVGVAYAAATVPHARNQVQLQKAIGEQLAERLVVPMLAAAALVIGVLNRFEVWAPDRWDAFVADSERLLEDATLDVQWPLPPAASPEPQSPRHPQEKPKRM